MIQHWDLVGRGWYEIGQYICLGFIGYSCLVVFYDKVKMKIRKAK